MNFSEAHEVYGEIVKKVDRLCYTYYRWGATAGAAEEPMTAEAAKIAEEDLKKLLQNFIESQIK